MSVRALEQLVGTSNGVLGRCINKGTDISTQWLSKIIEIFPDVNIDWLLTGEGNMLRTNEDKNFNRPIISVNSPKILKEHKENEIETRPRIPFDAAAGSLSVAMPGVSALQCEQFPLIPTLPDYDFTIIARGDSMTPDILSGDELACVFVQESKFIQWGRPHVLDTAQGIVLKRIFNQKDAILCRSVNHDYPDFEIPKDEIFHLAIVVGLIRHF